MKSYTLRILAVLIGVSLIGILATQAFWLKKTVNTAQKQFDHRADKMLSDVLEELKEFNDTNSSHHCPIFRSKMNILDAVDTVLLKNLLDKYVRYHRLDTAYSFAIIKSSDKELIYSSNMFCPAYEKNAYKACLSCVWKNEYFHLSVYFHHRTKNILAGVTAWAMLSILFVLFIGIAFIYILWNIFRQKKLDEMKNDFINNMTHEFKTPISTISIASEILISASDENLSERVKKYSKIIFDENQRMRSQVEQVLNIALMDRKHVKLQKESIDMHDLIYKTVESFCLEACEKEVLIEYNLDANSHNICADKTHLRNIINNLVDNAIKYSKKNPVLTFGTSNKNGGILVSIKDNGIGIPKDALNKIFDKFYRVNTGNIHDVKGFGLGLYYVKTMVEAHDGEINILSQLNKGSTFELYLPQ